MIKIKGAHMSNKEQFKYAKRKLDFMSKLHEFHEKVRAMKWPDFMSQASIDGYAKRYVELVNKLFGTKREYLENLKEFELNNFGLDKITPFDGLASIGIYESRGTLYYNGKKAVEEFEDRQAAQREESLKFLVSTRLELIEKQLSFIAKPKTNGWQRVFGGRKYFSFKKPLLPAGVIRGFKQDGRHASR